MRYCPSCGGELLAAGQRFCASCGFDLSKLTAPSEGTTQPAAMPPSPPAAAQAMAAPFVAPPVQPEPPAPSWAPPYVAPPAPPTPSDAEQYVAPPAPPTPSDAEQYVAPPAPPMQPYAAPPAAPAPPVPAAPVGAAPGGTAPWTGLLPPGLNPKIVGIAIAVVVVVAAFVLLSKQGGGGGGITFSPSSLSCSHPTQFTTTVMLPASVKAGDTLTVRFDGATISTEQASSGSMSQQANGTWTAVDTTSATSMQQICALGGGVGGFNVLTPGTHTEQILDQSGKVVAEGSYTVTP